MRKMWIGAGLLLLICFPFFVHDLYIVRIAVIAGIYAILALSLGLIVGKIRLVSAGHAAFFGIGAYTSAILTTRLELPFLAGFAAAAVLAGFIGYLLAFPILRLKGHYLAMATLAFGIIVQMVMLNWEGLTNGPNGIPGIPFASLFGYVLDSDRKMYGFVAFLLVALLLFLRRLYQSSLGRTLDYIREDEIAAQALGIRVRRYKTLGFTLSAALAGLSGSLFAHYMAFINYDSFNPMESFMVLAMVVVGGMSTLLGPVLGAVLLTAIPEILRSLADYRMLIYGLVLIIVLYFRPQGILGVRKADGKERNAE
ncbi:MAG TPA: branched-chain amino acid ABC transporter permease [Bacilli bacterium]